MPRPSLGLILGSTIALAVFALGWFAFVQFIATGRLVHLAQSFVPIVFGGWSIWLLAKVWVAWWRGEWR